jgi:glycosyltransferase involved in cell wall biosynthesis
MGVKPGHPAIKRTGGEFAHAVLELSEHIRGGGDLSVVGLAERLTALRPSVVVTVPEYLRSFYRDPALRRARRRPGFKLVLKTIPFRVPDYGEFRERQTARMRESLERPSRWTAPLRRMGVPGRLAAAPFEALRRLAGTVRVARYCREERSLWQLPDGHVNYIEDAYRVYGSYGVPAQRIHVIGNSPDTDRHFSLRAQVEQAGVRRHPHRLLHVGRLVAWKRVDLLLEAAHRLHALYPDLEVVVAGEGPMAAEWRQLSVSLGQQAYVRFVGGVYEPLALARLFMESGVYVLAGMGGISINDAMCYGCPVVCSVCDGTEKALVVDGETGLFFGNGDAEDLTGKVGELLGSAERQRLMGEAGTRRIREHINVHAVVDRYLFAFERIAGLNLAEGHAYVRAVAGSGGYDVRGLDQAGGGIYERT